MSMKVKGSKVKGEKPYRLKAAKHSLALAVSVPNASNAAAAAIVAVPWTEEQPTVVPSQSAEVFNISEAPKLAVAEAPTDSRTQEDDSVALESWLEMSTLCQTQATKTGHTPYYPAPRMANVSTDQGKTWKLREINKPMVAWLLEGDRWGNEERTDGEYPTRTEYRKRNGFSNYNRHKVRLVSDNGPIYKGPCWSRELSNLYSKEPVVGFEHYQRPPTLSDIFYQYWKDLETHSLTEDILVTYSCVLNSGKEVDSVLEWKKYRNASWWGHTQLDDPEWESKLKLTQRIEVESEQQEVYEQAIHPYAGDPCVNDDEEELIVTPSIEAANDPCYYDNGDPIEVIDQANKATRLKANLQVATEHRRGIYQADGKQQEVVVSDKGSLFVGPVYVNPLVHLQTLQLRKIGENMRRARLVEFTAFIGTISLCTWLKTKGLERLLPAWQRREGSCSTDLSHVHDKFFKGMQSRTAYPSVSYLHRVEMIRKGKNLYAFSVSCGNKSVRQSFTCSPPVYRAFPQTSIPLSDEHRYIWWVSCCAATEPRPVDFEERAAAFRKKQFDLLTFSQKQQLLLPGPKHSSSSRERVEPIIGDEVLETPRTHEFDMDKLDDAIDKSKPVNIDDLVLDPVFSDRAILNQMKGKDVFTAKIFEDAVVELNPLKVGMTADQKKELLNQFGVDRYSGLLLPKSLNIEPSEFKQMLPSEPGRQRSSLLSRVKNFLDWVQ